MAGDIQYEVCPETGIGCLMIQNSEDLVKIDLMPNEAEELQNLLLAGDTEGAKELLTGIDSRAQNALNDAELETLVEGIK